jgi:hypothetical protein
MSEIEGSPPVDTTTLRYKEWDITEHKGFLPVDSDPSNRRAEADEIAPIELGTGRIIVPDEDHNLYKNREMYGLEEGRFILENDPDGKYTIEYYERTDMVGGDDAMTIKTKARRNKETGKIEITSEWDELYTYMDNYGLEENDFEIVGT